ncbi:thiosulfate/3-mercaptopyruvate sulfurtransferase [Microbacterium resistens]|uniref:Thiosulfate/3-mercaptopyruvate sulfurtransferase n=1 Tax=Microbacterium resistens TaxID=156977 RepID=A0ABU1S7Z9_9MICO|nr:sulfurtransferase [Microbacterium resistens]MDR6865742.1 thiosulfate/3-mercaptopyruvate sulfurtransferase [Microbacterium resistens]
MSASPLISAADLRELLAGGRPVRILDARYRLGFDDGHEHYLAAHIPGAVFVDLERELSRPGAPSEGRHPLPADEDLAAAARRWGIREGEPVVVYDDSRSLPASRVWWALRRAGLADVRVLDGGLSAWRAAGGELAEGAVVPPEGDIRLGSPGTADVLDTGQVALWTGVLLDARAGERFRGETEPIDPVAGHIPGAWNLPIADVLTDDGRFRSAQEIADAFEMVGAGENIPIAAYCGSGVTAAQLALAGALIGREVTVYPGSWSAWSNTPGLPVATGSMPAEEDDLG